MASYRVALAGNPNTGKSTLFNALTGLRQHTGNWAGKTVLRAEGQYEFEQQSYTVIDLPGTYSLFSNSTDEEVARDYIIFDKPDVTLVVLDATALERNMNLALQVMEMTSNVVLCINLMDEARRLGISIDAPKLADKLGVPVVKISARSKEGIHELLKVIHQVAAGVLKPTPRAITYSPEIEQKIQEIVPEIKNAFGNAYPSRWIALRLIEGDDSIWNALEKYTSVEDRKDWVLDGQSSLHY
ncbi:50S ribosome-binding GTPase [Paenibacillus sp. J5C_2022]|uniref:FeoB small GTPase domain-containing protein n=1 Tax=Paenibacillus sp. J5C2022 TaxID=2977129 RepID=UPI0021CF288E|nr:FeoB small GTPase domain-containing protein [Paenibacillus sp. J5C2022]MCU6711606.1 50S ribosome-binding GTPase [Paenibacillus sp. J5C2022]